MESGLLANVISLSFTIVQQLYARNFAFIRPFLHPDVTWMCGSDNRLVQGRETVLKTLAAWHFPSSDSTVKLFCPASRCLCDAPDGHAFYYAAITMAKDGLVSHSISMIWETAPQMAARTSADTSGAGSASVPALLHHIHATFQGNEPPLRLLGLQKEQYFLLPSKIFYVEADNIHCHVACENQVYHVNHPLAMFKELLPDYFLQVHRRFLVNIYTIQLLAPYRMELSNETELPVPERKYSWLVDYINQLY